MTVKARDTVIWTWNIQKARVTFPKRNRFADIMKVIAKSKAEIVLISELNEERAAVQWMKVKDIYGVLVHGKNSGILHRDGWAVNWITQGFRKKIGTRSTAVEVDQLKLVATYQPIWCVKSMEFRVYREVLEACARTKSERTTLIVGGDFNSSVGDTSHRDSQTTGAFGLGRTNPAGET